MREVRTLQQLPSDEVREQGSGLRAAVRASKHRRRWSLIAKDANASIAIPSSVARPTDQEVRWQWRMGAARRCKASAQCMFGRARPFETQARAAKREREGEKQTFTAILVCFDCSNPSAVALDSAAPHHAHGAAAANPLRGAACHWRTEATSVVASEAPARCAVEAQPPLFAARRGHGFRGPTPTARPVLGEVPLQRRQSASTPCPRASSRQDEEGGRLVQHRPTFLKVTFFTRQLLPAPLDKWRLLTEPVCSVPCGDIATARGASYAMDCASKDRDGVLCAFVM